MVNIPLEYLIPPHRVSHPEKMYQFAEKFIERGWGPYEPLVGYPFEGSIQLLSGSHRYAAALLANLPTVPVVIRNREAVENAVGDLEAWKKIMDPYFIF